MKRSIKKFASIALVGAMMIASFAGCAKKESSDTKSTFLIGGSGPLTGDYASYGISVRNAAQIAIDEINAAGGVNGTTFELKFLDDEAGAQQAISAYNKLMDDGVDAILGTVTSGSCEAIAPLTNEDGILQITPSASSDKSIQFDNQFRICFTDPFQGAEVAKYAVDKAGYKNIAIIYNVGDTYSIGITESFKKEVTAKGATIVAEESYASGDVDFNTQLTKIQSTNPDVIFIPGYYQEIASITNQAAQKGMTTPYLGVDGWDGVLNVLKDTSVVEGATFTTPFVANDPDEAVQKFVKAYEKAYNATPDQFAADAYDGVYCIKAAIEKAGSTDNDALIKAMHEIKVDGLTGTMTFTEDGEANKEAKMVTIVDGKYVIN